MKNSISKTHIIVFLILLVVTLSLTRWNKQMFYGVCVHPIHFQDINGMKELGVDIIREDLVWANIEKQKGIYNFSYYDDLYSKLNNEDIKILFILDYSNSLYYGDCSKVGGEKCHIYVPTDSQEFEIFKKAYGNFCYESVKHFKGEIKYFEMWNEPYGFWQPKNPPESYEFQAKQYTELAKECYTRGKEANPKAIFLAGGLGLTNEILGEYIRVMFENGFANYYDIFGIHPYCNYDESYPLENQGLRCQPLDNIDNLKQLMLKYGGKTEMWITEFGYPTDGCGYDSNNPNHVWCFEGLSEENQVIRINNIFKTLKNYPEITAFFWYDYMDDGGVNARRYTNDLCTDKTTVSEQCPEDKEFHFGLIRDDLSRKPAYYIYQNIIKHKGLFIK